MVLAACRDINVLNVNRLLKAAIEAKSLKSIEAVRERAHSWLCAVLPGALSSKDETTLSHVCA